jgi:hypothetical protein
MLEAFFKGQTSIAEDLVFPSKAGTVLDQSNRTQYHFLPCLDRAGLPRFRFHDRRHTFGSLTHQGRRLAGLREGSNGPQLHPGDGGYVWASYSGADIAWVDRLDVQTTPQQMQLPRNLQLEAKRKFRRK